MLITHCYDISSSKEQYKYKGNVFITHINFFIIIARADLSGHSSFLHKIPSRIFFGFFVISDKFFLCFVIFRAIIRGGYSDAGIDDQRQQREKKEKKDGKNNHGSSFDDESIYL